MGTPTASHFFCFAVTIAVRRFLAAALLTPDIAEFRLHLTLSQVYGPGRVEPCQFWMAVVKCALDRSGFPSSVTTNGRVRNQSAALRKSVWGAGGSRRHAASAPDRWSHQPGDTSRPYTDSHNVALTPSRSARPTGPASRHGPCVLRCSRCGRSPAATAPPARR